MCDSFTLRLKGWQRVEFLFRVVANLREDCLRAERAIGKRARSAIYRIAAVLENREHLYIRSSKALIVAWGLATLWVVTFADTPAKYLALICVHGYY